MLVVIHHDDRVGRLPEVRVVIGIVARRKRDHQLQPNRVQCRRQFPHKLPKIRLALFRHFLKVQHNPGFLADQRELRRIWDKAAPPSSQAPGPTIRVLAGLRHEAADAGLAALAAAGGSRAHPILLWAPPSERPVALDEGHAPRRQEQAGQAGGSQDTYPVANNRFLETNAGALHEVCAKAASALVTEAAERKSAVVLARGRLL